jgi:hypothetical protein
MSSLECQSNSGIQERLAEGDFDLAELGLPEGLPEGDLATLGDAGYRW